MAGEFPQLFSSPKPLMLGAGKVVLAEAAAQGWSVSKRKAIRSALRSWTGARRYLEALAAPGATRFGLDGQPVAPVDDDHRAEALRRLEVRKAAVGGAVGHHPSPRQ
jgi:sRNA-binding protein